MQFSINCESLYKALTHLAPVISTNTTPPILKHVLLDVTDYLTLRVTDLDNYLSFAEGIHCEKIEGACAVPFAPLFTFIKTLPMECGVHFQLKGNRLIIWVEHDRAGFRFDLPTLPAEEFPQMRGGTEVGSIELPRHQWSSLLELAMPMMSMDETRYVLNGILLHEDSGYTYAAATDGKQMREIRFVPGSKTGTIAAIVRASSAGHMTRLAKLSTASKPLKLTLLNDEFFFVGESWVFNGRLVDGNYPNYRQVIPAVSGNGVTVNASLLGDALLSLVEFPSQSKSVVLAPSEEKENALTIGRGLHDDSARATVWMPCAVRGTPEKIACNCELLRTIVDTHQRSDISLDWGHPLACLRIDHETQYFPQIITLLMPVRMEEKDKFIHTRRIPQPVPDGQPPIPDFVNA